MTKKSSEFHGKAIRKMEKNSVKKAIHNMGGPTIVARQLRISTSTVSKWMRNGVIPNFDKAQHVAKASGFEATLLRPRFEQ